MSTPHRKNLPVSSIRYLFDYDPDTGIVTRKSSGGTGTVCSTGRKIFDVEGKMYLAHRIAFAIYHGRWPAGLLDHRNGDYTDNRIVNLREATHTENARNGKLRESNKSGFRGVCWHSQRRRWVAQIRVGRKNHYLGLFDDIRDAVEARRKAEKRFFGAFSPDESRKNSV